MTLRRDAKRGGGSRYRTTQRDIGCQPSDVIDADEPLHVAPSFPQRSERPGHRCRNPDVDSRGLYAGELRACNPDDCEQPIIESELLAEYGGVPREVPCPESVADHDYRIPVFHAVFLRQEEAAKRRLDSEQLEEVRAHHAAHHTLGVGSAAEVQLLRVQVRSDGSEARATREECLVVDVRAGTADRRPIPAAIVNDQ